MKIIAVVTAALLMLTAASFSADLPDEPLPPQPAPERFDWSGFYVGGTAGYAWSDVGISLVRPINFGNAEPDAEGLTGGGYVGFNYTFYNNVVIGVEGDAVFSDLIGDATMFFPFPDETWTSDIEWMASIRARLGYAVTNNALLFVTGGWAWAEFDGKIYDQQGFVSLRERYSETFNGYSLGAGGEFGFAHNWVARLEYRFTDFCEKRFDLPGGTDPFDVNFDVHEVRGGLAYKF